MVASFQVVAADPPKLQWISRLHKSPLINLMKIFIPLLMEKTAALEAESHGIISC